MRAVNACNVACAERAWRCSDVRTACKQSRWCDQKRRVNMSRVFSKVVLTTAVICLTAVASFAQQQTTTSETKTFEVLAVQGNDLVVRLPEGTREMTVPPDFRFMVNGQPLAVGDLRVGMKGTATITTRTTLIPVTVTEVKNGTVVQA